MNFLKLLLALTLIAQVNFATAQDDGSDESWGEETTMPVATPIVNEDAAGEEEMPVYDEGSDY